MTKYPLPLLFSFFLALILNTHSKAQIVYPDKAIFDIDNLSMLIDFETYNAAYADYHHGPDAAV